MAPGDRQPITEFWQRCRKLPASLWYLALGAALLIAAILSAALIVIDRERATALASAQKETANLVTAFEEHILRTVRTVDDVLLRTREVVERSGLEAARQEMRALQAADEDVISVVGIADATGEITASSAEAGSRNIAHRVHFQAHVERPDAGLVFGLPVQGLGTQRWTMHVARRISRPDGSFGGVVTVGVDLEYLTRFYSEIDLGADAYIALLGRDGYVRAVGNAQGAAAAQNRRGSPSVMEKIDRGEVRGSLVETVSTDGVARIVSFRGLADYPLIVVVGISEAEALRQFKGIRDDYAAAAAALIALVLLLGGALGTLIRQQIKSNERLRASEARFRAYTNLGADWYWESDARYCLAFASSGVSQWMGGSWMSLIGKPLWEVGFVPVGTVSRDAREAIQAHEAFRDSRIRYVTQAGQVNYFSASGEPIRDADEQFSGYRGICRDITTEVRLQQRLRLQNETARLLASERPVAEVITDLLQQICTTFDWDWGVRRLLDDRAGAVSCAESWCVPEMEAGELVRITRVTVYPKRPDGLVTVAIESGEPCWRTGESTYSDAPRASLLRDAGILGVVVIPIPHLEGIRGALQFFSRHAEQPDAVSLETLRAIATEVGQFLASRIERENLQRERERQAALSALLESLAAEANQATSPEQALAACLERICAYGDWTCGDVLKIERGGETWHVTSTQWYVAKRFEQARISRLMALSERKHLDNSTGPFINHILRNHSPSWLQDLGRIEPGPRLVSAREAGLRAAFAFPVIVHDEVVACVEFFATQVREPDTALINASGDIASHLARVIERDRAFRAKAELAAIVESTAVAIFTRALDGTILTWNPGAEKMLGWSAAEAIGAHVDFSLPPGQASKLAQNNERILRGEVLARETRRLAKDGRVIDVLSNHSPIRDGAGNIVGATVVIQDITEFKRVEEELRRKTALAQLLEALARAANEAGTPGEAMRLCLARICEHGGWLLGRFGRFAPGERGFVPGESIWHETSGGNYAEFKSASLDPRNFSRLGRFMTSVMREKKPVWVEDITLPVPVGRLKVAAECGLRAAYAFPVTVRGEIVAFLEFFAGEPRPEDSLLVEASTSVAAMLARLIERSEAVEERERLAAIVETTGEAIWSRAADDTLLSWNAAAERLFGWTREEVIGRRDNLLVPPEHLHEREEIPARLARGENSVTLETVRLRKDGTPIDVEIRASVVRDDAGNVVWTAFIAHDIRERKRAEEELRRKTAIAQLLEALARAVNEATTPAAAMGKCLEHICAYGRWELGHIALALEPGMSDHGEASYWHVPRDDERFAPFVRIAGGVLDAVRGSGRFASIAMRERRPVWISDISQMEGLRRLRPATEAGLRTAFGFPVFVREEPVAFVEFLASDVHEPDEALLAAGDSIAAQLARLIERDRAFKAKAELAAIVETATVAIISRMLDGTILTWNPGAEKMLGWSAAEVIGRSIVFTIPPHRPPNLERNNESLMRGEVVARESDRLTRDGRVIDVLTSHSPIRDGAGNIVGASVILQDITERKAAERALRDYSMRLQMLSRKVMEAQEHERSSIARELHDQVGQTLSAAKLNLQVFQRQRRNGADVTTLNEAVDTVDQALQQVRTLALDLRPPQLDDLGLGTALRSYAGRVAKPAGLKLHFSMDPVPTLPPQIDIACFRVAQGALTNVIRHARAENVWVKLTVEHDMLCLHVRDDGKGCDLNRAHRQAGHGYSMGLLSMEERTRLAGGRFTITSEPGAGMEVHAEFPIAATAHPMAEAT